MLKDAKEYANQLKQWGCGSEFFLQEWKDGKFPGVSVDYVMEVIRYLEGVKK